jgi:hypothetical protein
MDPMKAWKENMVRALALVRTRTENCYLVRFSEWGAHLF